MAAAPFLEIRCEALDDPRDELLRRVEAEELSRADADKIARERYGFDSIDWPDASRFDPMMAAEWSLPMVFAWVICRNPGKMCDPETLLRLFEPYRCEARTWVKERTMTGFERRPRRPPRLSVADVLTEEILGAPDAGGRAAVHAARDELACALRPPGRLVAFGWPYPTPLPDAAASGPAAIPAAAWADLTTLYDLETGLGAHDVGKGAETRFVNVFFYREEVLAIWPISAAALAAQADEFSAPSKVRKRKWSVAAIDHLGLENLRSLSQKARERQVNEFIARHTRPKLTVSSRFVEKLMRELNPDGMNN